MQTRRPFLLILQHFFNAGMARDVLFLPVDGGQDRACRGANPADNNPAYYRINTTITIDECKELCKTQSDCTGIEYSYLRCEVWTRTEGISSVLLDGSWCLEVSEITTTTTTTTGPDTEESPATTTTKTTTTTTFDETLASSTVAQTTGDEVPTTSTSNNGWSCSLGVCTHDDLSAGCRLWISTSLMVVTSICLSYSYERL